jgi:putative spermidine/putrescine transport system substrate-binding protein
MKSEINRRSQVAASGGPGAMARRRAAARRSFGAQQAFAADLGGQELRTVGLSVTVQERILNDFKKASGVKAARRARPTSSRTPRPRSCPARRPMTAGKTIGERLPSIVHDQQCRRPFRPQPEELGQHPRHLHQAESDKWDRTAQIVGQIWADEAQTVLNMVPTVYNYDSIGYNPDLVSAMRKPRPGRRCSIRSSRARPA